MLLDDSIELDYNDSSARAEPLPVNWDIDVSKIWIPSFVLPNRKKQINTNENKPFVLHTLEKSNYSKSFSVYIAECPEFHESQTSPAVPSTSSQHKLINEDKDGHEIQQTLPSSQIAAEWNVRLDIGSDNVISPKNPLNNNEPNASLRDYQVIYNSMVRNATQSEKKVSDTRLVQEASYKPSLEDLTCRMAEILSEDEPLRENCRHEDLIKTNQVATSSAHDSIPPSAKDSLEEIYYSDEDGNYFAVGYELDRLNIESPEKKPLCSIYTEKSFVQEQLTENLVNDFKQSKNSSDKIASQSFQEIEKIQFKSLKEIVDNELSVSDHGELNGKEFVVHTNDSEQQLSNCEGKSEDPIEKVPELPIAYKRPPLQEQTSKTKPQKGKKKAKKAKVNIPFHDLFQSEDVDRFQVPEVDEFYENLVRQDECKPLNKEIDNHVFPSINYTEKMQRNISEFPSTNLPDESPNLFWASAQQFRESLSDKPQANSQEKVIRNEEKSVPGLPSKDSLPTIIVDNIPLNVSKENIESCFLGVFGVPKNLAIKRHGKFQRAKLQMDLDCDIDWIIECLNDSQPFGSSDKELIKCYRQS